MGRISFDPVPVQLGRAPLATAVYRYDGQSSFRYMPNIRLCSLTQYEGANPTSARFRYILDDGDPNLPFPTQFEDLFPLEASSPYKVNQDDRLVVVGMDDDGDQAILFDGFAQIPELSLTPETQKVAFVGLGVECRLWDSPAEAACYRDANKTDDGDPIVTALPVRFNPTDKDNRSQPNCTLAGKDASVNSDGDAFTARVKYPLFLDERINRNPTPLRFWSLGPAIRYLLGRNNPKETYVSNGDTAALDAQLQALTLIKGIDGQSYRQTDIVLRDYDVGNRPAIVAIADLCESNGFAFAFRIATKNRMPQTKLQFYRRDGLNSATPAKDLFLGVPGDIDPAMFNVGTLQLSRDVRKVVNSFQIETAPLRYEASFILAPGFKIAAGDESDANRKKYIEGNWDLTTTDDIKDAYRVYIFDECGDGHWDRYGKQWVTTAGDLSSVLNVKPDGTPGGPDDAFFVKRYRPALTNLIRKTLGGEKVQCQLHVSRNYPNKIPSVWDGTGDWQPIDGGFQLLDDRLGIRVSVENPEAWEIGKYTGTKPQNSGNILKGVTAQSAPSTDPSNSYTGKFTLRLTCVIEGDQCISATVDRRPTSPTKFAIVNRVDARDNFLKETITSSSAAGNGAGVARDDTTQALAYATALQAVHETAPGSGSVTIPRFTDAYRVGDRIRSIYGRNCSLRSNAGSQTGELPQYPTITSIEYQFEGQQTTTLTLTEHRVNPQPIR